MRAERCSRGELGGGAVASLPECFCLFFFPFGLVDNPVVVVMRVVLSFMPRWRYLNLNSLKISQSTLR